LTVKELVKYANQMGEKAELADEGKGHFRPGHWCRFCPGADSCKHRASIIKQKLVTSMAKALSVQGNKLTDANYAELLNFFSEMKVENWIKQIKAHSLNAILSGEHIEGWKAVEGRGRTVVKDFEGLKEYVLSKDLCNEEELYAPAGITALKKAIGAKGFKGIPENCLARESGRPTLAEVSDARQEFSNQESAKTDFSKV
jgi:hypothetical protein